MKLRAEENKVAQCFNLFLKEFFPIRKVPLCLENSTSTAAALFCVAGLPNTKPRSGHSPRSLNTRFLISVCQKAHGCNSPAETTLTATALYRA